MSKTIRKEHLGDWIREQPLWARDALRRLSLDELDDNDTEEILINLKKNNGINPHKETTCENFTDDHFKTESTATTPKTLLCSIGPSKHVNRLADDQVMDFDPVGITLVYGHNGSGKSGYCRISKQLCRARVKENLLDNAYKDGVPQKQEVGVKYQFEGEDEITETWINGETDPPEPLGRLTVFDDKCARFYVDKENKIEYLPPEIELLKRHADLLGDLQEKLELEIAALKRQIEASSPFDFAEGTQTSKLTESFKNWRSTGPLPTEQQLRDFAVWSDADDKSISDLKKQLNENPVVKLSELRTLQAALSSLFNQINPIEIALATPKIDELEQAFNLVKTTTQIAKTVASEGFAGTEMAGTGTDPWKRMYEHAVAYATSIGALNNKIPSEINDLCLLCQQGLSKEASERLKKFETFIEDKASKDAAHAQQSLNEKISIINNITLPEKDQYEPLLQQHATSNEDVKTIATSVETFFTEVTQILTALKNCIAKNEFTRPKISIVPVGEKLTNYMLELVVQIKTLEQQCADDQHFVILEQQMNELRDRKKLNHSLESFIQRLKDFQMLARLSACLEKLNIRPVSYKVKSLRDDLLTESLEKDILQEIHTLDLAHIPFVIKNKIDHGDTLVGVKLKDTAHKNHEILSEGEQRALALACFLAEVKRDPVKHGIILDDPVSSFDHVRIKLIAKRLAKEAKDRQVIIFTHNILFYNAVKNYAKEYQIPPAERYVSASKEKGFGMVSSASDNWHIASVDDRIRMLNTKRENIANAIYDNDEHRRDAVKDFYSDLRETWERLIEDVLFNKVITRYDSAIKTQSLAGVMVEDSDYETIYWAMKKASENSGHDRAEADAAPLPTDDDILADLEEIKTFKTNTRARRNTCDDRRRIT